MALSAVHKVLKHGLISEHNPDAAEAMHCIADAVTLCRFEATDPDHDDVVLSKILHVLLESVRCPTGALLSDDDVCNIVQACYRIGHQSGKESALLRNLSRHTLREIVQSVFRRLPSLSDAVEHRGHHIDAPAPPRVSTEGAVEGAVDGDTKGAEGAVDGDAEEAGATGGDPQPEPEVISPRAVAEGAPEELTPHGEPFGLACVLEIFRFACSFISLDDPADENAETMCAFGLQLVLSSLETSGDDFARHPALLKLVQDDLSRAVLAVAPAGNPPVLAASAATVLQMYMVMHHDLKLQLEAFLRVVLLPLAEGPAARAPGAKTDASDTSAESQRIALECIVDLCRQPEFVPDLYVNYDCDLERPNLFEEVCALLSRSAFPGEGRALGQINLLCLEGLLAIVAGIADRSADAPPVDGFLVDGEVDFTAPSSGGESDPKEVWAAIDGGSSAASMPSGVQRAHRLRRNRDVKRRLISCAEHFNKSPKKGLAYMQEIGLLPDPLEANTVARFFKHAPGLDKETLGEYLGDPKDFMVEVLKEYCATFDFHGVTLDKALRSFLDGFKLPGEAQKISRILEVFAARYHESNPGVVADADSAFVLSYSIIMLNTDQHNPQVKRKMTLDQFIRNNRGTNGGEDWPRETLEYIFEAIATDEIKLESTDTSPALSQSRWNDIVRGCATGKGRMMTAVATDEACMYDGELFGIVWSPTVSAVAVVFDHPVDDSVLKEALDGFLAVARVAGHHRLTDVMDSLVGTLCKFASPSYAQGGSGGGEKIKPSLLFGDDDRARTAAVTAFTVASRYGDNIRHGWRHILNLTLRLHRMDLLSDRVRESLAPDERDGGTMRTLDGAEASTSFRRRERERLAKKNSGSNSILRGFSQLLSLDTDSWGGSGGEAPLGEDEKEAEARAVRCVDACRVDEVFADSKFLETDSLQHMVRALVAAAGGKPEGPEGAEGGAEGGVDGSIVAEDVDEDAAAFCLDVLVGVTLRNRDRVRTCLPLVYGLLRQLVQTAKTPSALAERAIFEVLRLCRRLLPHKEDLADELLDSLRLMFALEPAVADAFLERIVRELGHLVAECGGHVRGAKGWETVCKLLMASARHPDAAAHGFEALRAIVEGAPTESDGESVKPGSAEANGNGHHAAAADDDARTSSTPDTRHAQGHLRPWNIRACVEAVGAFVDAHEGGDERSVAAVGLISSAAAATERWCSGNADGGAMAVAAARTMAWPNHPSAGNSPVEAINGLRAETIAGAWTDCVSKLVAVAVGEDRAAVRDDAILTLQRVLLASDGLNAPATHWCGVCSGVLMPVLEAMGERVRAAPRGDAKAIAERTARLGVSCVAKAFLQYLPAMLTAATPAQFAAAWTEVLDRNAEVLKHARSEELREAVPEAVKNMLLVMSAQGVLAPGAPEGIWETTWKKAAAIDAGLTPAIVGAK